MSFKENLFDHQFYLFTTPLGVLCFIIFYSLWVCILLPGSWISMLGGFLYGSFMGTIYVFIGAIVGAAVTFISGRLILRNWIQSHLDSFPRLKLIEQSITSEGLKIIILTRLSPAFPFGLLNLAYGISNVKFKDYLIGLIAILPGTFVYCSLGALAIEVSRFQEVLDSLFPPKEVTTPAKGTTPEELLEEHLIEYVNGPMTTVIMSLPQKRIYCSTQY